MAVKLAMRTDRHNNPTAFTTDIAKVAGLQLGKDYTVGDSFKTKGGQTLYTARLEGDPLEETIKVIDRIGFYTNSGTPRWTHTAMPKNQWDSLNREQKAKVVKSMYQKEGGSQLLGNITGDTPSSTSRQMDYNQFAQMIKQKYPEYNRVDNLTLAKKIVEKYPVYASKVNIPGNITNAEGFNPNPFGEGPGQINLEKPKIGGDDVKQPLKEAKKVGKGLLNVAENTGIGLVKGTGTLLNNTVGRLADRILPSQKNNKGAVFNSPQSPSELTKEQFTPKGTSQKVGAVVGHDVFPGLALGGLGGAGLTALGVDLPAIASTALKPVKATAGHVGRNWWKYGLLADLIKGKDPVNTAKGLLKVLIGGE